MTFDVEKATIEEGLIPARYAVEAISWTVPARKQAAASGSVVPAQISGFRFVDEMVEADAMKKLHGARKHFDLNGMPTEIAAARQTPHE